MIAPKQGSQSHNKQTNKKLPPRALPFIYSVASASLAMLVGRLSLLASAATRMPKNQFRHSLSSTAATTRPFKILGVQQIAIGCAEKGPLNALWKGIFGFEAYANKRMEGENVDEDILKLGPAPFDVEVDLMTPINPEGSPKVCFKRAVAPIYIQFLFVQYFIPRQLICLSRL